MPSNGLSKVRLARLHDVMGRHVGQGAAPGLVSIVSRRGVAHVDTIGTTAVGGGSAVQPDTIFRISSMTKPITAVATLILLEECALRLDEPVERLLPELADRRVVRRIDGPVDDNGQVVNREAMDALVEERVLRRLDHKNLNADVPEFATSVATTENLATLVHGALAEGWTLPARLARVRISETARNTFELEVP